MKPRAKTFRTLAIDVGNTTLFCGLFSGARLVRSFRLDHSAVAELPSKAGARIDRAVMCSVVPRLTRRVHAVVRRRWKIEAELLTSTSPHGLAIKYRRPSELGTDRLATALGARAIFPRKNLIIVDCGTATTVTALNAVGELLGGAILPGLALWPEMLVTRTAQLPGITLARPAAAVGRSPSEGIESGVFFGHCGAIREIVGRIKAEAFGRAPIVVIGTGGHAPLLQREGLFNVVYPELILTGLQQLPVDRLFDA